MKPLTARQKQVLEFIEKQLRKNSPPSQREIAFHFGLTQNAVYQLIGYLKEKGYLVDMGGHRGLRLSDQYLSEFKKNLGVPIVGRVAAGEPILAQENIEGYIDLNKSFGEPEGKFLLKVVGDSMVDEGIMDGDFVVVEPTEDIKGGQIAVVLLDDEATIKRIYFQRDRIALKPANKKMRYKTKHVKRNEKDVRIIGRVIGCLRQIK